MNDIVKGREGHGYKVFNGESLLSDISFQDGPIKEVGINGVQNIDIFHILYDRMHYLNFIYPSKDNEYMLLHVRALIELDEARTRAREKRNVEGTSKE